ncbi:carboxylesterase family protein [Nocardiopsis sp. CT-R113]|uniref:Carboxylic ester hydrolase n=1 Tax=Nocardiopsis codii TaxID=3065942 RepID=A0ABU7K4J3_9ACTN|nr:carboxylesterase family protein [Nocardiopsis sp. CT-R113]MEE2037158.1 carboxylesterase family protein [Nocardiopsis sp. CT-R113]
MDAEHTAKTTAGRIRGTTSQRSESGGVTVHRGIPYAAAPFGDLRFSAPAPAPSWDGVRDCTAFGPPPPQGAQLLGAAPWNAQTSLDCLSLSVWSAAREGDRAPVLVWIHGGAYIVGASSEAVYDGTRLAESGLVVVGVNYRVGFEGFGHVPGRPDNRGLLDQAAALRWVRDNIAAFGGDPDNVTVAGESAGAGSVVCLMASPVAQGLFRRAIAHSVPGDMVTVDTARSVSERVAAAAGVPLAADALAALPPEAVLEAVDAVLSSAPTRPSTGVRTKAFTCFAPVVGGPELPRPPLEAVARGSASGVDLLTGHNTHEYRLFTELGQPVEIDDEAALAVTAAGLGLAEGAVAAYRSAHPGASLRQLYAAIQGDALFSEYTVRFARAHASGGGRSHLFRLAFESPAMDGRLGACHALDLPFAFGNLDTDLALFLLDGKPTGAHAALSARMVAAWRDFAAMGDPGWPAVTAGATPVKVWDVEDALHAADTPPVRALWAEVSLTPR